MRYQLCCFVKTKKKCAASALTVLLWTRIQYSAPKEALKDMTISVSPFATIPASGFLEKPKHWMLASMKSMIIPFNRKMPQSLHMK